VVAGRSPEGRSFDDHCRVVLVSGLVYGPHTARLEVVSGPFFRLPVVIDGFKTR